MDEQLQHALKELARAGADPFFLFNNGNDGDIWIDLRGLFLLRFREVIARDSGELYILGTAKSEWMSLGYCGKEKYERLLAQWKSVRLLMRI